MRCPPWLEAQYLAMLEVLDLLTLITHINAQKLVRQKLEEQNVKDGDNYNTMINRNQLIAEELIREHVSKRIKIKLEEQNLAEAKLRKVIRRLIEAETGTEEASRSTGINVLADLLEKIIPIIEDDYKMLTSSKEQRDSFRNHIIHAIENTLRPIESQNQGEKTTENIEYEVDAEILAEKLSIDLDPRTDEEEGESVEGEFIDIEGSEDGEESFVRIEDQDKDVFYDYLLTNTLLYFDKFEDEIESDLPDVTTAEYEEEAAPSEEEFEPEAKEEF